MDHKLNAHDLIKCLTAPLTDVNHRWLNLCTQSLYCYIVFNFLYACAMYAVLMSSIMCWVALYLRKGERWSLGHN